MGRGIHNPARALAEHARRLEAIAEAPLPAGRGRAVAIGAKQLMRQRESNVIELEAHREPAPVVTAEPSPLTLTHHELATGDAAVDANINAGLIESAVYLRSVLADARAPHRAKMQAIAALAKLKADTAREQLKAHRQIAADLDLHRATEHERSAASIRRKAVEVAEAGHTVIAPDGKPVRPRDRAPMDASGDDDYAPEPPAPLNAKELEAQAKTVEAWTRTTNQARKRRENADRHHAAVKARADG